jgi:hypothetical protein
MRHLYQFLARVRAKAGGFERWASPSASRRPSAVRGWGSQVFDSSWNKATDFVEVAAGYRHTVANARGQCNMPALPVGVTYVEIAAGWAAASRTSRS